MKGEGRQKNAKIWLGKTKYVWRIEYRDEFDTKKQAEEYAKSIGYESRVIQLRDKWYVKYKEKESNPGSSHESASKVAEGFHGRANTYIEDIIEVEHYRSNLAHLGDLVEFEILDPTGRKVTPINFAEHDSEEHVSVGSTSQRNQLILSGGNQSIDLDSFDDLSDSEKQKDLVQIGLIHSISYFTDKHHLEGPKYQQTGTEYIHVFGEEEGGEKPLLVYDKLNCRMWLVGGSYEVRDEGIYN